MHSHTEILVPKPKIGFFTISYRAIMGRRNNPGPAMWTFDERVDRLDKSIQTITMFGKSD